MVNNSSDINFQFSNIDYWTIKVLSTKKLLIFLQTLDIFNNNILKLKPWVLKDKRQHHMKADL